MAKGDRITVAAFNTIQSSASTILGTGSGASGYGQRVSSSPAIPGQTLSSTQWNLLREDMRRCYRHQTNADISNTPPSSSVLPPSLQLITSTTIVSDLLLTQYTNFTNNGSNTGIVQRKDVHSTSQLDPNIAIVTASRSTPWGGTLQSQVISSTITVTFPGYTPAGGTALSGANHMRCFFNAGGSIDIQSSRADGIASTKNTIWSNMLNGVGKLSFKSNTTSISGAGINAGGLIALATGWHNAAITFGGAPVTLVSNPGPSGVYLENDYTITVQKLSNGGLNNQLQFVVTFRDDDIGDLVPAPLPGPAIDETVDGTLTVAVACTRPFGTNVDVPAPSGTASNPA
jgi:hypothetical protein